MEVGSRLEGNRVNQVVVLGRGVASEDRPEGSLLVEELGKVDRWLGRLGPCRKVDQWPG